MPINPALLAQGQHTRGGNIAANTLGGQRARLNDTRNALLDIQLQEYKSPEQTGMRQDNAELQSIISGVQAAYPLLAAGNAEGALNSLRARREALVAGGRDPGHTDELIANIEQGNIEETLQVMGQYLGVGSGESEGFTLAPGAQRFDAAGNPIANNPKEPTQPEKVRLAIEAGLEPGSEEYSDFLLGRTEETGDLRSRKIADAMRLNEGLTEQQATKIVDGQATFKLNEQTGKMLYTDLVTKEVNEIPVSGGGEETPAPAPGQTLRDLSGVATGPVSGLTAKTAAALSFFGIDTDEASTGAQQTFRTQTQALIRALAINPRFPVAEMERIKEEISIQPSMFQGEGTLNKKIDSLDTSLRLRLEQAERDFDDPNLDVKTRQAQGANASALRNFLTILGGNPEGGDAIADEIAQLEEELGLP